MIIFLCKPNFYSTALEIKVVIIFTNRYGQQKYITCFPDFSVTKTIRLQNTSSIPIQISLSVDEDDSLLIIPSEIFLEKMDSTTVEVTYLASELGSYKSCIRVQMEAVGTLTEILVEAKFVF